MDNIFNAVNSEHSYTGDKSSVNIIMGYRFVKDKAKDKKKKEIGRQRWKILAKSQVQSLYINDIIISFVKKNGSNDPRRTYAVPASSFANHTAKYIPITRPAIRGAAEVKVRGTAEVKERNPFL